MKQFIKNFFCFILVPITYNDMKQITHFVNTLKFMHRPLQTVMHKVLYSDPLNEKQSLGRYNSTVDS